MKKPLLLLTILICLFANAQNARFFVPYREGNKWGFCDTLGKVKIAPQFTIVNFFNFNEKTILPEAIVRKDTNTLVINETGKTIIPAGFKSISPFLHNEDIFYVVYNSRNQQGIYANGKPIIAPNFYQVSLVQNKNFLVTLKENGPTFKLKYGMINLDGEIIIPAQYDKITRSAKHSTLKNHVWIAYKGSAKTKFEDKVKFDIDSTITLLNDNAEVEEMERQNNEAAKRNGGNSTEKNNNNAVVPIMDTMQDNAQPAIKIVRIKTLSDSINEAMPSLKNKYQLDSISPLSNERYFYYVEKGKQQGIIDDSLKIFLMNKHYNIQKIILNHTISWLYIENQSLALFLYYENGKYGATNEFGDEILKAEYDDLQTNYLGSFIKTKKNNKYGYFLINTIYKPIATKYEYINLLKQIKINDSWYFDIFEVTDAKGNKGYVGENGIEYFKN